MHYYSLISYQLFLIILFVYLQPTHVRFSFRHVWTNARKHRKSKSKSPAPTRTWRQTSPCLVDTLGVSPGGSAASDLDAVTSTTSPLSSIGSSSTGTGISPNSRGRHLVLQPRTLPLSMAFARAASPYRRASAPLRLTFPGILPDNDVELKDDETQWQPRTLHFPVRVKGRQRNVELATVG